MVEQVDSYPAKNNGRTPLRIFFKNARDVFKLDKLGLEIAQIAFPTALALLADPIASLVYTAFIGQIGPVELAAVGVSIAVFNQVSRIAIFPLVSVTTSFVAEEDAAQGINQEEAHQIEYLETSQTINNESKELIEESGIPSSSSILPSSPEKAYSFGFISISVIGGILGLIQAILLISATRPILKFMGVKSDSWMLIPAQQYLAIRSLGAPAVLLSLAMQGVFRGFKDTTTPLYATGVGSSKMGRTGSDTTERCRGTSVRPVRGLDSGGVRLRYLISIILLWGLMKQVYLLPPSIKNLQFSEFLTNGFLLLMRVIAVIFCVTLAASTAVRQGSTSMAAFQAILTSALARKDYNLAAATVSRVLQLGLVLRLVLSIILGCGLQFVAKIFTKDVYVLLMISLDILVCVAIASVICMLMLSSSHGFIDSFVFLCHQIWRIGTGTGPWNFLWT
ncbi:Multi antimicrobial extrusion protein [Dillenia turbinata]|uniref:Protein DETOXIFICATION n=1 Tax=Dillenia turbinata TaxID=194707 RepID=A0AAN8VDE4_9MAGN